MTTENIGIPSTCSSTRLTEKLKKLMQAQLQPLTEMEIEQEEQKQRACLQTPSTCTSSPSSMATTFKSTLPEIKKLCNEAHHPQQPIACTLFACKGSDASEVPGDVIAESKPPDRNEKMKAEVRRHQATDDGDMAKLVDRHPMMSPTTASTSKKVHRGIY